MMAGFSRLHRRYIGVIFFFFSFYISHIMLRVDPSLVVPARIRLPAFPSPCLHQIFCFRYSIHSCTTFIHESHPYSFMRYIHSCVTLHLFIPFHISTTYVLHSFMRLIYPQTSFIHGIHSLMRSTYSSLFMYQLRCLISPDQFSPLSCITYTASYLLACNFSLSCIKSNV